MYDVIIVNGRVIDGSGNPAYRADIGIVGDRIVTIGMLGSAEAVRRIDATGLVIAPGFIDPHVHSEIGLLAGTCGAAAIQQGVTTHLLGADGFAYAPLSPGRLAEMRMHLAGIYGEPDIGWDWTSVGEYLARFDRRVPVNVVAQVGHHAIRLEAMGWDDRVATPAELEHMKALTRQAMEDGAVALATGLDYFPGAWADTQELIELCKVVATYGGVFDAHVRYSLGLMEAVREALRIGSEAGIPVHLSHLYGEADLFELLEQAHRNGVEVSFDAYPYLAGVSPLTIYLPHWAQAGAPSELIERLRDPEVRQRLRVEMIPKLRPPEQWDHYILSGIGAGKNHALQGRSFADLIGTDEQRLVNLICDLLIEERLRVTVIEFWLSEELVRRSLTHPFHMVASDGVYTSSPHPRGYGTYPRILGHYVRQERLLSLEDAVRRMTSFPAQRFGLHDRGLIKPGLAADLTLFDPERVLDHATYADPLRPPAGIPYVLVNGQLVVDNGRVTGATPGRALKPLLR